MCLTVEEQLLTLEEMRLEINWDQDHEQQFEFMDTFFVSYTVYYTHFGVVAVGRIVAFRLKGHGFVGKSFTRSCLCHFGMKLQLDQHSIRAVSGAPLSSSRLEEAP